MIISNTQKTRPYRWITQDFNIQIAVQSLKWVYTFIILKCIWIFNSSLEFKLEVNYEPGGYTYKFKEKDTQILYYFFLTELNVLFDSEFICHSYHIQETQRFLSFHHRRYDPTDHSSLAHWKYYSFIKTYVHTMFLIVT